MKRKKVKKQRGWKAWAVVHPLTDEIMRVDRFKKTFGRGWGKQIFPVLITPIKRGKAK